MTAAGAYPDFQKLVEAAGGYDRLTDAQWAQHQADVARWNFEYRRGLKSAGK